MANSKRKTVARKPRDRRIDPDWRKALGVHPDYPLFPHQNGRWAKKVRGKLVYFGKVADDPKGEAALDLWRAQKDDLIAGRKPRTPGEGLTVGDLCNKFLHAKNGLVDSGEMKSRTWNDYKSVSERLIARFSRGRLVTDLTAADFDTLRTEIAKSGGPVHLGNIIQRVRVMFKYAYDAGLIDRPVRYGPTFKKPSQKVLRLDRRAKGPRMLEATDVRKLLDAADVQLKAMTLLAVNCGFGNSDCGMLPLDALDLDGGWADYPRPKTGIDRRCPLWPETVEALREAIAHRPTPKSPEAEPLVFVTKYGAPWAKETVDNPVTKAFRKLLDATGTHRPGLGFYTLRHVFRTIADEAGDQPAAGAIMGHADGSMAAVYRVRIDDARLRAVADYVHAWLYAEPEAPAADGGDEPAEADVVPVRVSKPRPTAKGSRKGQASAEVFQFRIVG